MKKWNNPSLEELNLNATAYNPAGGNRVDGSYKSNDSRYTYDTFASSSGNSGTPALTGNDPSRVSRDSDGFVVVQ